MTLDLQLDTTVALDGHPRFHGEGGTGIDGHITGQDVGAVGEGPGGIGADHTAHVAALWVLGRFGIA